MKERPVVCPLNASQILIMGGVGIVQSRSQNNVFVFDTENE